MTKKTIAILGANSHIAKGLTNNFLRENRFPLILFTRHPDRIAAFLQAVDADSGQSAIEVGYQNFMSGNYDVVINCVGAGSPNKLGSRFSDWFTLTEEYDNLCLAYLRHRPETLYINFSSGAVYGGNARQPIEENAVTRFCPNHFPPEAYYSIVRLNSEAKHRAFNEFRIADLRIFSYFSRFIDLDSGYFITELLKCLLNKKTFITNDINMVRDYIHPDDLYSLVLKCIQTETINASFDAVSAAPVKKFQILDFFVDNYGLQYEINNIQVPPGPNGANHVYCSNYNRAAEIGYKPVYNALDAITREAQPVIKP